MYWVFLTVFINANQLGVFITMLVVFLQIKWLRDHMGIHIPQRRL